MVALVLLVHPLAIAKCSALSTVNPRQDVHSDRDTQHTATVTAPRSDPPPPQPPSPSSSSSSPSPASHLAKRLIWFWPPFPRFRDEDGDPVIVIRRPTPISTTPNRRNRSGTARTTKSSSRTSRRFINGSPTSTRRVGEPTETETERFGDPLEPTETSTSIAARQRERALLPPVDPMDPVDPADPGVGGQDPSIAITESTANARVTANLIAPNRPRPTPTDPARRSRAPLERLEPVLPPTIIPQPTIPSASVPSLVTVTPTFIGVPIGPPPQIPGTRSTTGSNGVGPAPSSSPPLPTPPEPTFQPNTCGNGRCDVGEFCSACPSDCSFQQMVHRPESIEKVSARIFRIGSGEGFVFGLTRNGPGYFGWSWEDLGNYAHRQKGSSGWQGPEARQGVLVPCWAPHIHQFASRSPPPLGSNSTATNSTRAPTTVVLAVVSAGLTSQEPSPLRIFVDHLATAISPTARALVFLDLHNLLSADAHRYRATIRYAVNAGHTIGIRLTAGAPPSLAQLTTALCVYAHLPEWLTASDPSHDTLHDLHAPLCRHPPEHIRPSTQSGWSPILHLTLPLPALFPGLPEEFTAALVALGPQRVRLVHPSFFVQEEVAHQSMADPKLSVAKMVQDLFNLHVGIPGWIIGLDLRAGDKFLQYWDLTKTALDTIKANAEVVSDPVSAIVGGSAAGFPVGSNATLAVTPGGNSSSPLGFPSGALADTGPSLENAARAIAERLPRAIQSVNWQLDSGSAFLVQEAGEA
ncbi:hypothetical protein BCR44DRAFT_54750 [Catenaria anguillulae PL171]|uniref:Uncharacterized protein n=1 Tax=Catenaria anguillulae PL171 TaxID=765915 RepID=A0A1Y2HBB3_9FUNG|nr:hypothetical protein BCR44DRAFT_54750 [Catenaria anguillulae PL171]